MKKVLLFLVDLPVRFIAALVGFTFGGWIGWLGIVLVLLRAFGVIHWPWWVAALPLIYGVIYCLYMTIDGALYRAGLKGVGGYARLTQAPLVAQHEQSKIQEIIAEGVERIAPTIDACCEKPHQKAFAQTLLDASLVEGYFLLQLAMFANQKVNAYITINKWKNAGLKLPAEGTPEFYPYSDSQKAAQPPQPQQRASETSEIRQMGGRYGVPQEDLDREVGIKPDELVGLCDIIEQISHGINDWLNPPSGVSPKTQGDVYNNLLAQLPKISSGLTALKNRLQEIWDRSGFDYTTTDPKVPDDEIRVTSGDLFSLKKARAEIVKELNYWVHPESIVLKEGQTDFGYLIGRIDLFAPATRSMTATLNGIRERNFGET
jgi:hypothetical protein